MHNIEQRFEYVGTEPFRIVASIERAGPINHLLNLASALRMKDPEVIRAAQCPLLAHELQVGRDLTLLIEFLNLLVKKLRRKASVAMEIESLLVWAGAITVQRTPTETDLPILVSNEFAATVLETVIPVAQLDFYKAIHARWTEIENCIGLDDSDRHGATVLSAFQVLADWVSRVNSPQSWHLLMCWLKHECPWVRNQTAWFLRRWWSPELPRVLCEALLLGVEDSAAEQQTFFLLWRLTQLADPVVLPILEDLIGTPFDREIQPPGEPPPNIPPSNMLRQAISACGGSVE